ncbi:MAG: hypothetical protein IJ880_14485 [Bacilli bacterium]|nr:hypothetical protein [Bacilli bacterium]
MYLVSYWIVDGENNFLYKYTNDILEGQYDINMARGIGNAAIAVGTDEHTIMLTCPNKGTVLSFDTGREEFTKSITVGRLPMGICEGIPYGDDKSSPYFITNYISNSVSIIRNGVVVQTLDVGMGPRSLATDGYGRIYVGNYLGDTVSVLAPKENKYVLFKTIKVDRAPIAVAINFNDDVYVACESSIVKIRKNGSVRKFTINGRPTSLTADKYGNVWATNNTASTIIRISNQEIITTYSSGCNGPMYCCSDKTGDILVLNTGNNTITRMTEDGSLTNIVELDYTPIGNGDFIGFLSRVNILDDIDIDDHKKVEWDDLSPELQEMIEAGVDPETLILKSDNITYEHDTYTNVTEALNALFYEKSGLLDSDIKRFDLTPNIVERGTVVQSLTFDYNIENKDGIEFAEIDHGVGAIDISNTRFTISGREFTDDVEFTLTVKNDTGNIGTRKAKLIFDNKIYYGISNEIVDTSEKVLDLGNSIFVQDTDDKEYNREMNIGGSDGYIYIAVPVTLDISVENLITSGFRDSNWDSDVVTVVIHDNVVPYTVFKHGYSHILADSSINVKINKIK